MGAQRGQVWKVGQLADSTGLTVRALHHYDHLGLVRLSVRTPSGYRLYTESDVERLYEVLALRQLGLPLEAIGDVLDGSSSVEPLLERHRAYLDRQMVAIRTLRAQLASVAAGMRGGEAVSVIDFLELIRKVITVDETVKQYFSDEQLADLAERRAQLGEETIARVQAAWPDLIARVPSAVDAGVDPATLQAQELAGEWMGLSRAVPRRRRRSPGLAVSDAGRQRGGDRGPARRSLARPDGLHQGCQRCSGLTTADARVGGARRRPPLSLVSASCALEDLPAGARQAALLLWQPRLTTPGGRVRIRTTKEATTTDAARPEDRDSFSPDDFYRAHSLDELLAGAEPHTSIDELAIEGLTDDEADAFLEAIGG